MEWSEGARARLDEMSKTQPDEWSRAVCLAALGEIWRLSHDVAEWRTIAEELRGKLDTVTGLYNEARAEVRDLYLTPWKERALAAEAEVERLRAWEDGGQQFLAERDELRKEVERLQAEVAWWQEQSDTGRQIREKERAEAALRRIEDLAHDGQDRDAMHAFGRLSTIESKARAALAGEVK